MKDRPLVVVVGPTASGKTALAISMAKKYGGEIICADSRTVYRHMDIGTAKPTSDEQGQVPHWGIDLVDPDDTFSVADFKMYADKKIREIRRRGHVPFLVGGSGLYVDAVLFDYQFGPPSDPSVRQKLEGMPVDELQQFCTSNAIQLPRNLMNKRHLIRAIEQKGINNQRNDTPLNNSLIIGIQTDSDDLRTRIRTRGEKMVRNGLLQEAKTLAEQYGWESQSMTGNVYPICRKYSLGEISSDELVERIIVQDRHLAKKQMTWFRRNKYIEWFSLKDAEKRIRVVLDSE